MSDEKEVGNTPPRILRRADIDTARDHRRKLVPVPEWGGSVYVQSMTGHERNAFIETGFDKVTVDGKEELKPKDLSTAIKLLVRCLVDEGGQRLYKDDDATALAERDATVLDRLVREAMEVCGLVEGAVEEAAKN